MSNQPPRPLPDRPNLRHLKDQAQDLLKAGRAKSLTHAQFQIARLYGFESWPKLKAHIDSLEEIGQLKRAIDTNDLEQVKSLMTRNPALHRAPLGYGRNGPLTWVAECRVPWAPPSPERLAMAQWMIDNGSDVHQGGDGPLMRAALRGERIPMMEILVAHGANVNAEWNGDYPILFAPCESVNPDSIRWLLAHGAHPNCPKPGRQTTAIDYVIGTYGRSPRLAECIDLLTAAGGATRYDLPGVLDVLRNDASRLAQKLDADPALVDRRFPDLDCGSTAARRLLLQGATLLHVAAEYGSLDCARLLLDRGASPNAPALIDESGIGGQTPIFHSVSQYGDYGLPVTRLLLDAGASLALRVKIPGHYDRPAEFVESTPLAYALQFPGEDWPGANAETVKLLRDRGAPS